MTFEQRKAITQTLESARNNLHYAIDKANCLTACNDLHDDNSAIATAIEAQYMTLGRMIRDIYLLPCDKEKSE